LDTVPSAREPARFDATLIPAALFQKGRPLRSEYWLILVAALLYQFHHGRWHQPPRSV